MAHYAVLDENNIVIEVIVGRDEDGVTDWEQIYSEIKGKTCKRTSYNTHLGIHLKGGTPFRKNFAGIGYIYHQDKDYFSPPKTEDSWILDHETGQYVPPVPYPTDGNVYEWDESTLTWQPEWLPYQPPEEPLPDNDD